MKTLLVIGSNSDIAKAAITILEKDYMVIRVDRSIVDLSKKDATKKISNLLAQYQPDVVLNSAGIFGENHEAKFDDMFNINLKSNWAVIKYYIANPPDKPVKIIMLGSSCYNQGRRNFILYASTKAALYSMWQGASEFINENVKLGLINPVHVHTKLVAHKPHPKPDICLTPEDVAKQIVCMAEMTESQSVDMDYKERG